MKEVSDPLRMTRESGPTKV
jgi:hypothetical protein